MPLLAEGLDRQSQLLERGDNSKACWLLDCQLVVAAAKVLDEGVSGDHDPGAVLLFEPAHRPEPRLQPAVVAFDAVVGVLVGPMPRRRQQVIEHCRYAAARSVVTSIGVTLVVPIARSKNLWVR